jgi:hypothetical protein
LQDINKSKFSFVKKSINESCLINTADYIIGGAPVAYHHLMEQG